MHTRLTAIVALAALGLGSLALAGPSAARQPGSIAYMSMKQLQRTCKAQGGTFGAAKPRYYCVLASKAIICDSSARQCSWATATTSTSSGDDTASPDYPPASLSDGLLVPDGPVMSTAPIGPLPIAPIGPIERGHGPRIPR